ncbi:hypothetical protein HMJ29_14790 [Hymenobacter taeanensis]|uniref:Lipoprotein n=1 Tax=Hymenobacter taeanensis TaxID=2735321 RepID=A0A6M6BJG8_9BACT|nr:MULTISPECIES: hypothetical protein [Hymenobacter]QJX48129.1 hypothetical protein HMJ29_14790 [Hymenobacter taeanensis]UOQ82404.1 hypothetical protein MUN83_06460 [Hymenobacter sp. 5414T-23]
MALSRTLCFGALLLAGAGITSCLSAPDYPDVPEITFKSIQQRHVDTLTGVFDRVIVTVGFKDGDGDLGLNTDDINSPFNELDLNGQPNRYYNNYFFQPQLRNSNNQFEDYNLAFSYNGRYPRLSPSDQGGRKEPLKGDLNFKVDFFQGTFPPKSVVRFKVKIADRALHESNEVITEPITVD